jgi:cbb3-type cytochrome oxidase subunit 3
MLVIVLEALGALALLLFFVWWTMFSGRRRGERTNESLDAPGGELDEAGRTRD